MKLAWGWIVRLRLSLRDRQGQALVEYGLILTLVLLAALAALSLFGHGVAGSLVHTDQLVNNVP